MFYKFLKDGRRQQIDLRNVYEDGTLFLLAGAPSLKDEPLELLNRPGIVTMGINNSPSVYRPQLWVSGDRPECFAPGIAKDTGMLKFASYSRRDLKVHGKKWKHYPGTLFYSTDSKVKDDMYLEPGNNIAWWHSTWWVALQLAWKLGFRDVYMLGAEFKIKDKVYAWDADLSEKEISGNKRLYHHEAKKMRKLKPLFDRKGLRLHNCSTTSEIADTYGYTPLKEAVEKTCINMDLDTVRLPHSHRK